MLCSGTGTFQTAVTQTAAAGRDEKMNLNRSVSWTRYNINHESSCLTKTEREREMLTQRCGRRRSSDPSSLQTKGGLDIF